MPLALTVEDAALFRRDGYVVVRGAYSPGRVAELLAAVRRFLPAELPPNKKFTHLLHPEKFQPSFAHWLAEDAAPHLEALIDGGVRRGDANACRGAWGPPGPGTWPRDCI
jgi:hypothetical protein